LKNALPHLFIIDDDDSVRRSLSRLVKAAGFSSQAFSSAQEFLEKVSPDTEGCLILDVRMPGMSGLDLQDYLIAKKSTLPIIFISAIDSSQEKERAMKAGARGFLCKPFSEQELMDLIHAAAAL
jgi:FixJ family two-component response regulator